MTRKKKILISAIFLIPVMAYLVFFFWKFDGYCYSICPDCGSHKRVFFERIPGQIESFTIWEKHRTEYDESEFYKDFFTPETHKHRWCPIASKCLLDGNMAFIDFERTPPSDFVMKYNQTPEFRKNIQGMIKSGEYTKQQIIELSKPENEKQAQELVDKFHKEN